MYNIKCEVNKKLLIMILIGIIITAFFFLIKSNYYYAALIITSLLILYLLRCVFKYLSLKFKGTYVNNVPYEYRQINNKDKILIINFQLPNGNYIRISKKKVNWSGINETGFTSVLINYKNPKHYYIFDPYTK